MEIRGHLWGMKHSTSIGILHYIHPPNQGIYACICHGNACTHVLEYDLALRYNKSSLIVTFIEMPRARNTLLVCMYQSIDMHTQP